MNSALKGNYEPGRKIEAKTKTDAGMLEEKFAREALKRPGGGIAYVAKKKIS